MKSKIQEAVDKKRTADEIAGYKKENKILIDLLDILSTMNQLNSKIIKTDQRIIKIYEKGSKRDTRTIIGLIIILGVALTALNYFLKY